MSRAESPARSTLSSRRRRTTCRFAPRMPQRSFIVMSDSRSGSSAALLALQAEEVQAWPVERERLLALTDAKGHDSAMAAPHPLLAPLAPEQQLVVDSVAEAFLIEDCQWPFYDYVEGVLEEAGLDAIEVLHSFPTIGRWGYSAVAWNRNDSADSEVALTVVGMSHTSALRANVPVFFALLDYLAQRRRQVRPRPREVRNANVTSAEFDEHWRSGRRLSLSPRLTAQLREHEPGIGWSSRSLNPEDGSWTTNVSRQILRFEGLKSLEDYIERLEGLIFEPAPALPPILPSPLSLAAALDYLNVVWRLTHDRQRLFRFTLAERTTRLAFDVQTPEEFAAHVSAFSDILREANKQLDTEPARRERSRPLARIEADVVGRLLGQDAAARAGEAIRTLESIIALRDADQHGEASGRAVTAHRELRITYPTTDWRSAWEIVSTQAVNALSALREEIEAIAE